MTAVAKTGESDSAQRRTLHRITRTGVVASDARDKTIKVVVSFSVRHPKYGKIMKRSMRLHAHDPNNEAREGDVVEIMDCRPMSKTKTARLVRIVRRGASGPSPAEVAAADTNAADAGAPGTTGGDA